MYLEWIAILVSLAKFQLLELGLEILFELFSNQPLQISLCERSIVFIYVSDKHSLEILDQVADVFLNLIVVVLGTLVHLRDCPKELVHLFAVPDYSDGRLAHFSDVGCFALRILVAAFFDGCFSDFLDPLFVKFPLARRHLIFRYIVLALVILDIHLILRSADLVRLGILVLQIFNLPLNLSFQVHTAASWVDLANWGEIYRRCCFVVFRCLIVFSSIASVAFRRLVVKSLLIPSIHWASAALVRLALLSRANADINATTSRVGWIKVALFIL